VRPNLKHPLQLQTVATIQKVEKRMGESRFELKRFRSEHPPFDKKEEDAIFIFAKFKIPAFGKECDGGGI